MRRYIVPAAVAAGLVVCGVAIAADSYTVTAKAGSGGSKDRPAPVSASFDFTGAGPSGARPATPKTLTFTWDGLRENGGSFATCTADKIDAAQSDSGCPKGALVGSGQIKAELGPEGNRTSNANCQKDLRLYNGGAGKLSLFAVGDPSKCAGVSYLAPIKLTWKVKDGKLALALPVPDNIAHALPGLEGAFSNLRLSFKKLSVRKSGKSVGYLSSVGCSSSKRGFTAVVVPDDGTPTITRQALTGAC